jgi:hypothetical protein
LRAPAVRVEPLGSDAFDDRTAGYANGVAIDLADRSGHSTEEWARAALEDMPLALRWFVVAGWRLVLLLRLGPRNTPDYVLGWKIVRRAVDETVLEVRSPILTAHLVFRSDQSCLVWSTFVHYDRRLASFVWPPVSLLHRRIVPYALRRAASRLGPPRP